MESKGPCVGQRHILALLAATGFLIGICMRVNMSITLKVMVNSSSSAPETVERPSECMELILPSKNSSDGHTADHGEFHWSKKTQFLILNSFLWGYWIFQVPAGTYAQKYGGKWIFGTGVVFSAIITLITPVAARLDVPVLIIVRILEGIGESITYPALQAMLGRWAPKSEVAFLNALCYVGRTWGSIVGVVTARAIYFVEALGWTAVFFIDGTVALVWFMIWCFFVFDSPIQNPKITAAERCYLRESTSNRQVRVSSQGVPWKRMLVDNAVWAYIVTTMTYQWAISNVTQNLLHFMAEKLYYNIESNEFIYSLPYISLSVFQLISSYASDQVINKTNLSRTVVRKIFTCLGLTGMGVGFIGLMFTGCNVSMTVALFVVIMTFAAVPYGGLLANPLEMCPEFAGTLFGIGNSLSSAVVIFSPFVATAITKNGSRNDWDFVFVLTAVFAFTGALFYLFCGSGEVRPWVDSSDESEELMSSTALRYFSTNTNS